MRSLKKFREEQGFTQEELALKVGVSKQFISFLETGLKEPSLKLSKLLAKALDVSLDELVS